MAHLIFLLLFSTYLLTLAPGLTFGDSGELASAAWHLGVAHPPGYPAWVIPARLVSWILPMGSVAFRTNLFSALASAGALTILYSALVRTGATRPVSAALVLVAATGPMIWSTSVVTEVYSLNFFFITLFAWALVRYGQESFRPRAVMLMGLVSGLALGNHTTSLCLVPMWVILSLKRGLFFRTLCCFLVGLSVLGAMALMANADPAMNWGDPSNLSRWLHTVTRAQYGSLAAKPRTPATVGSDLVSLMRLLLTPALAASVLACGLALFQAGGEGLKKFTAQPWFRGAFYLMITFSLAAVLIIAPGGEQEIFLERHFFMPFLIPLLLMIGWILGRPASLYGRLLCLIPVLALPFQVEASLPLCDQTWNYFAVNLYRDVSRNVFADRPWEPSADTAIDSGSPSGSPGLSPRPRLLLLDHDDNFFPLIYARLCTGDLPPLYPVCRQFMALQWYMEQLRQRRPDLKLTEFEIPLHRVEEILQRRTLDLVQSNQGEWDISLFLNFRPQLGAGNAMMPRGLIFRLLNGKPGIRDINLSLNSLPGGSLNHWLLERGGRSMETLDLETRKALSYYHLAALNGALSAISEGEYQRALDFISQGDIFAPGSSVRVREYGNFVRGRALLLAGKFSEALKIFQALGEERPGSGSATAPEDEKKGPRQLAPGALDFHMGLCWLGLGQQPQGDALLRKASAQGYGRSSFNGENP